MVNRGDSNGELETWGYTGSSRGPSPVSVDHSITRSVLQLVCLCLKKREDLSFIDQGSVLTEGGVCFLQIEGESEFEGEKSFGCHGGPPPSIAQNNACGMVLLITPVPVMGSWLTSL